MALYQSESRQLRPGARSASHMNNRYFDLFSGKSFYRYVCEMIANILAINFLLKLSSKTHLNAPNDK